VVGEDLWDEAGRHSAGTPTGGWTGSNPPGRPDANQLPMFSMSAGGPARSSGVAGHRFVQFAEGLLDAGVELISTLGAVLDGSGWLGRRWRQPGPGLVGDRTRLVALGAVEAIIGGSECGASATAAILGRGQVGGQAGAEVGGNVDAPARAAIPSAFYRVKATCGCRNLVDDFARKLR